MLPVETLPPLKKKYFEHGLARSKDAKAALKNMAMQVKKIRKEMGLTQTELAQKAGCSRSIVDHIERALNYPSLPVYLALCKALGQEQPPLT